MSERRAALISQRQDRVPGRAELRDALDRAWAEELWAAGYCPHPVVNVPATARAQFEALRPSLVILSGGNDLEGTGADLAPARDQTERMLLGLAGDHGVPRLGVCRGAQLLAVEAGMRLVRVMDHVDRRHALRGPLAEGWAGPPMVASFHHWGVDVSTIPEGWDVLATAEDGAVEAFCRRDEPVLGVLWHPERAPRHLGALLSYLEQRYP